MKKIKILMVTLLICSFTTLRINAEEGFVKEATTPDEIAWENVSEVIVLYDDGTFVPSSAEIQRRSQIKISYNLVKMPSTTHFSKVEWITRGSEISLRIVVKDYINTPKTASWIELFMFFMYHPTFSNIDNNTKLNSMYHQYACHYDFKLASYLYKGFSVDWYIEPIKADKGYQGFVRNACN